ncbi:MAG: AMP-dependent synthetase [Ideonella sp. MAG2]|nr:MAG: AMP-dependent synthetase [Ideonella sp. MAG2]
MVEQQGLTTVMTRQQAATDVVAWHGGQARTRAQFERDVAAWAWGCQAQPGQRMALYAEDTYTFAAALMGAWQANKTVVLPGDAQAQTVQRLAQAVDFNAADLPQGLRPEEGASPPPWPFRPLDLQRHCLVVQTSGSSGEPLDIDKQLSQLDAEVRTLEAAFGARLLDPALRVLTTVSHQHIYGLLFQVLWPLSRGRAFVAGRLDYPEAILAAMSQGPNVLVASPAHLKRFPDTLPWAQAQGRTQAIFSSGGPLLPEASHEVYRLTGLSPIEVYGSSETGGIAWRQRATHGDAWCPFAAVRLRQVEGLLEVASPNLPDDTPWLTSDLVRLHPDGRFELLGRADRIVKIEEKRVSLTALERTLLAQPGIGEAKVFPLPEADRVRLAAVVVLTEAGRQALTLQGKKTLTDGYKKALLQVVERVALPRRWRLVAALPVNAQGKVTESLLTQLFRPEQPPVQWLDRTPTQALAMLDIVPELAVFDGHFQDHPLVPGVAQLDWAIALGRECFSPKGAFSQVDQLKFQVPIFPGRQIQLHLQWDAVRSVLSFQFHSGELKHSGGKVTFHA